MHASPAKKAATDRKLASRVERGLRICKQTEQLAGSIKIDDTRQGTTAQSNPKPQNASPSALVVLELAPAPALCDQSPTERNRAPRTKAARSAEFPGPAAWL